MLLKSITLTGFKSFGARTTLELDPGITVIVGPNGSGKSNIVDAVAWATGGQSTRGLRADRSDDLLFTGGAGLPPASRAEVTLVFDNASGFLPIDRPEVSITRRYYRTGESDFEINRVACRLMDITELLAEAGLRKSRYALVGQGQVDQILNASPVEHRRVLEEAAGVGKHLWRRDRAVRRLESTRSDLERVEDLIAEKNRRVRPLRRQAQALGRYQQLAGEIRSLRLFLEGEKLREIDRRLEAAVERRRRLESVRSRAEAERSRGLAALSAVESAQEALRTESASDALADWEMVSERMRRLSEVATLRAAAGRHRRQAERRRLALGEERRALEGGLTDLDGLMAAARMEVEESHNAVLRLSGEEQRLSALRSVDSEAEMGALLGERATLEAAAERDRRETEAVDGRLGELASLAEELDSEIAGMNPRLAKEESELRREGESLNQKALEAREKRLELQAAEVRAAEARRVAAESSGRLEAARRTLRLEDPQRAKRLESFTGWTGWVSELLEVPEGLGAAVEAGLERWAEAAAFEGPVALGNAVHRLEDAAGDDGPVLMVTARFPDSSDSLARSVAATGAGMTPLIELLEGDSRSDLAVRLLGDVVLVEDWKTGWEVVGTHPQLRAVTRQGDLVTSRGSPWVAASVFPTWPRRPPPPGRRPRLPGSPTRRWRGSGPKPTRWSGPTGWPGRHSKSVGESPCNAGRTWRSGKHGGGRWAGSRTACGSGEQWWRNRPRPGKPGSRNWTNGSHGCGRDLRLPRTWNGSPIGWRKCRRPGRRPKGGTVMGRWPSPGSRSATAWREPGTRRCWWNCRRRPACQWISESTIPSRWLRSPPPRSG